MIRITDKVQCCGCNACGDVCAHNAITYKTDIEGFWYPEIDEEKCVECGLCEKVCPIINIGELKKNDFQSPVCYAAESKNLEVIFDSTSGGLFSVLANIVYRSNGYVGGAIFNEDFSVKHYISSNKSDLPKLRSSKYLQSNLDGFYRQVKDLVNKNESVLVCGTPCQMAALRRCLKKDCSNIIIVDFICRGINSPKVWKKYIKSFEERFGSPVVYAKAKSKELGWRNLTQKVVLKDGRTVYETGSESNFTKGYLRTNAYCRPSCYDCQFKGYPRISDITLADFWGIEKLDQSMEKNLGTSLVMINSEKGRSFFEKAKPHVNFIEVPFKAAERGNPALTKSLGQPKVDRKQFFEDLDKMNFSQIADKYIKTRERISILRKCKDLIKAILYFRFFVRNGFYANLKIFRYNSLSDILGHKFIQFTGHCNICIKNSSKINVSDRVVFGYKRINSSKLESRLLVEDRGELDVKGPLTIYYGADIEVFKDSRLVFCGDNGANINLTIICGKYIEIGRHVQIGRNVTIRDNNGNHYINRPGYKNTKPVIIGDKAWLCEGCTIMPGVKVGEGAIVGAHAFVTSNVPAHSIVSGNPAVVVDEDVLWKY